MSSQRESSSQDRLFSPAPLGFRGETAGDKRNLLEISGGSPTISQLPPPTDKEERVGVDLEPEGLSAQHCEGMAGTPFLILALRFSQSELEIVTCVLGRV
ncbi:uncharacterized protein LOC117082184 isoform X2 [Trachypithecus francoisi]|uniref:uncharacterized protein LOC117082184 isoform X2 n=1 Tax=Trachypithecus francoisi TaxID=54180 RepID=UPI00141B7561|nr:uncharacterized protein LOC117082184 isoform X2 [Trachypithecus francoisi]